MKIEFLGPIERPEPQVVKKAEEGAPYNSISDVLFALGFSEDKHRLIRVFADGEQLRFKDPLGKPKVVSLMLTVGGG